MEQSPAHPAPHGIPQRGLNGTPSSSLFGGRFGRMFRSLPSYDIADASLIALSAVMVQAIEGGSLDVPLGTVDEDENTATLPDGLLRLPAGYTYFGQFVDHDITFDPASDLTRQNDPDALTDFRTPAFDLDSLYGRGPSDQPYLYEQTGPGAGIHLTLGELGSPNVPGAGPDLLRVGSGRAIIGDPRNDENVMVSQLQVAIIRFHNAVADQVAADHATWTASEVLTLAQQQVRWHYQWVVIHDFLPRLVGQDVVDSILSPDPYLTSPSATVELKKPKLRFFHWKEKPYMPIEFSVAAYRYGHSVIRPSYVINDVIKLPVVPGASRIPLFTQTGTATESLNGFKPLPTDWGVQWKYFLPFINGSDPSDTQLPQPSYKLDAKISHPLGALPNSTAAPELVSAGFDPSVAQSLSARNLLRGKRLNLPSGQDVAKTMGITPLTDEELFTGVVLDAGVLADLAGRAPLWYYVLKEAEIVAGSAQLGPVGGRIVAEVLIGLLVGDPLSYFNVQPNWQPTLPSLIDGNFTLSDLINFAIPAPTVEPTPGPYPN